MIHQNNMQTHYTYAWVQQYGKFLCEGFWLNSQYIVFFWLLLYNNYVSYVQNYDNWIKIYSTDMSAEDRRAKEFELNSLW